MKIINFFKTNKQIDTNFEYIGITKYIPLIICGGFYFVTILLFAFGPFDWNINNEIKLYSFLILCLLALISGYFLSVRIKRRAISNSFNIDKIIIVSFLFFIITYVFNTYATTGKIYPDIIRGIFDSSKAYRISHSNASNLSTIINYCSILISPITAFLTPLFFIYYKKLSNKVKTLGIISLLLGLLLGIAQGVINSFATFVFQISIFLIIYIFSTLKNGKAKEKILLISIIVLLLFSFLLYYKTVMSNRLVGDITNSENSSNIEESNDVTKEEINNITNVSAEFGKGNLKDHYFLSFLPDSILSSTNHLISYITHGYKGLSLAMEEDFTSSYGLGFSDFFRHNILKVIGKSNKEKDYYKRTYMSKIEKYNWSTGKVWSTFFVFPASDISFPLTILLVFIIGFVFGLSWRDALESKNIFATVVFINFMMLICFFSANNGLFQNGGSFITVCVMCFLWGLSRVVKGKE